MTEPLVSVMMITYNQAPFIVQAIEGVLQQKTSYSFELVIGEDCSTDSTRESVFAYQKKYPDIIRVITSDNNVGMKKNGLRTWKACKGKYISYCEGDDYWHSLHKLQKQSDYLESHPECGLVYSSYDVYHVVSRKKINDFIKYRNWKMPNNPTILDFLGNKNEVGYGILTCTVMVRRALCEQVIELDPYLHQSGHFLMGDTQLWAEISTRAHLHYIPESLATHNITDDSATRSKDIRRTLCFERSQAELMLYLCDKYGAPSSTRKVFEESWYVSTLRLAFHTRSTELANEVRMKKEKFTFKEWALYYGAKSSIIYYSFCSAILFRKVFKKAHMQWH
jgi:glycosyltransferase involved in cell wall biosynthesis